MTENTNMTEQTTQAENMGTEAPAQETDNSEERLFTQEEVNSFVKSQVARMMKKATKDQEAEYNQRLSDLHAREMKMAVKEKLSERNMPKELADIISGADEAEIDKKLDALEKIYGSKPAAKEKEQPTGFIQIGATGEGSAGPGVSFSDPIGKAMGL